MIRNEVVTIDIGGSFVYPLSCSITNGTGKGYNTCVISGTNILGAVGDSVTVSMNGNIHSFIVDSKDYGKNDKVTFQCKGIPCQLEDIVISDTDFTYIDSDALIEDSRGTIAVVNNIPNIVFNNQVYSKTNTPLSRIKDMVNVVGGEIWEVNGTLYLDEQTTIPLTPTIAHTFADNEILDYSYTDKRDTTLKVKDVLINPITEDIYSESSVTLEYIDDEMTGEIYFNPSLSLGGTYTVNGLGVRDSARSVKDETISVSANTYIKTLGGIDTVVSITLNGEPILPADYVLYAGYNVIRFLTPKTGEIIVSYYTKSVSVYAYRTTLFEILYECSRCAGEIVVDADNITNNGFCYTEIVEPITYEDGGSVLVTSGADVTFIFVEEKGATNLVQETTELLNGGGTLTIKYLYTTTDWVSKGFMNTITSANKSTIETMKKEVLYDDDLAEYVVFLDKPITSINDIYFGSSALSGYSYNDLGAIPYIIFLASDVGKEVDISVTIDLTEITIPAPTIGHPVRLLDVISCGGVATSELVLADNAMCSLPATFKVDVAGTFNLPIEDVFGASLSGDFGTLIVDNFGKVEVTVSTQGVFTIICGTIKENGVITIDSQGVI